jgi:hypothetical protein
MVEWSDEVFGRAAIAVGDKVVRPASGTLTKRGRPPVGDALKQQVTLRLPREVIEHFQGRRGRVADADQRGAGASCGRGEAEIRSSFSISLIFRGLAGAPLARFVACLLLKAHLKCIHSRIRIRIGCLPS